MLIDSHAHLVFEGKDNSDMFENMHEQGLEKIINIGTEAKDSADGVALAGNVVTIKVEFFTINIETPKNGTISPWLSTWNLQKELFLYG